MRDPNRFGPDRTLPHRNFTTTSTSPQSFSFAPDHLKIDYTHLYRRTLSIMCTLWSQNVGIMDRRDNGNFTIYRKRWKTDSIGLREPLIHAIAPLKGDAS